MANAMGRPLPPGITDEDVARAKEKFTPDLLDWLRERVGTLQLTAPVTPEYLVDLIAALLFRQFTDYSDSTGLVFAGYGSSEFMPSFISYNCYGHIYTHLQYSEDGRDAVTEFTSSVIRPFAQSSMIDTFVLGFSQDATYQVQTASIDAFKELAGKVAADLNGAVPETFDAFAADLEKRHRKVWTKKLIESHADPVRRVIGSLPVEEMAELAETLILLQSLKEKVTLPSASVSGPIDVAAISKSDGFIWIKRKHYFNPALNPRFFQRQQARYLGN